MVTWVYKGSRWIVISKVLVPKREEITEEAGLWRSVECKNVFTGSSAIKVSSGGYSVNYRCRKAGFQLLGCAFTATEDGITKTELLT